MQVQDLVRSYDTSIIVRRWAGCWIDFIVVILIFLIPDLIGNDFYQATLWLWLALAVLYFPIMESLAGGTVGKHVMRLAIVDAEGNRPGIGAVLIRTCFRVVEVNPFLAGGVPAGIIAGISKTKQRLGDMAAGTYVVRREHLPLLSPHLVDVPPERYLPKPRSLWAVAAGYLGLLSLFPLFGPFAIGTGVIGLYDLRKHPERAGRGAAIFGIAAGSLAIVLMVVAFVAVD